MYAFAGTLSFVAYESERYVKITGSGILLQVSLFNLSLWFMASLLSASCDVRSH